MPRKSGAPTKLSPGRKNQTEYMGPAELKAKRNSLIMQEMMGKMNREDIRDVISNVTSGLSAPDSPEKKKKPMSFKMSPKPLRIKSLEKKRRQNAKRVPDCPKGCVPATMCGQDTEGRHLENDLLQSLINKAKEHDKTQTYNPVTGNYDQNDPSASSLFPDGWEIEPPNSPSSSKSSPSSSKESKKGSSSKAFDAFLQARRTAESTGQKSFVYNGKTYEKTMWKNQLAVWKRKDPVTPTMSNAISPQVVSAQPIVDGKSTVGLVTVNAQPIPMADSVTPSLVIDAKPIVGTPPAHLPRTKAIPLTTAKATNASPVHSQRVVSSSKIPRTNAMPYPIAPLKPI